MMDNILLSQIADLSAFMKKYDIEWLMLTSGNPGYACSQVGAKFIQDYPEIHANFMKLYESQRVACTNETDLKFLTPETSIDTESKDVDNIQVCRNDSGSDTENDNPTEHAFIGESDTVKVEQEEYTSLPEHHLEMMGQRTPQKSVEINKERGNTAQGKSVKLNRERKTRGHPKSVKVDKERTKRTHQKSLKTRKMNEVPKEFLQSEESKQEATNDLGSPENMSEALLSTDEEACEDINTAEISKTTSTGSPSSDAGSVDSKEPQPSKKTLKRWQKGMKKGSLALRLAAKTRRSNLSETKVNEDGKSVYECDVCCAQFDSVNENFTHHRVEHVNKYSFPCRHCDRTFRGKKSWLLHMTRWHGEKISKQTVTCENCGVSFPNRTALKAHKCSYQGTELSIVECQFCSKTFIHEKLLEVHIKSNHADKNVTFKCSDCHIWFSSTEELNKHVDIHQNPSNQCQICKKWFKSKDELHKHGNCQSKIKSLPLECEFCQKTFRDAEICKQHMLNHVNFGMNLLKESTKTEMPQECDICLKVCKSRQSFRQHMMLHVSDKEKPLKCEDCGKAYTSKSGFRIHLQTHLPRVLNFICDICGQGFTEKRYLKHHIRKVHTGEKPFTCSFCEKTFFTSCALRSHKRNHHFNTVNICEICGYTFPSHDRLRRHRYRHFTPCKSERPTKCDKCDKVLSSQYTYKLHYATVHLTEDKMESFPIKVQKCIVCGKIFGSKFKLARHMRAHTGEKPYKCGFCEKSYADKRDLKTHERSHGEGKVFVCDCGKSFRSPHSLRSHKKSCSVAKQRSPEETIVSEIQKSTCACGQTFASDEELQSHKMNCVAMGYPVMNQMTPSTSALSGYSKAEDLEFSHQQDWSLEGGLQQSEYGQL